MKITLLTAVAAMALASAFTTVSASAEQNNYGRGSHQEQSQDQTRGSDRERDDQNRDTRNGDNDHREYGNMRQRHHGRAWRDNRSEARWDEAQYNGYYQNSRWHYGPPPADRYGSRGFALGYRPWTRGQRLGYYNGRYAEVDYRSQQGLRRPSRGYHWVRDNDSGDYLLAAVATGLIASVILNHDH